MWNTCHVWNVRSSGKNGRGRWNVFDSEYFMWHLGYGGDRNGWFLDLVYWKPHVIGIRDATSIHSTLNHMKNAIDFYGNHLKIMRIDGVTAYDWRKNTIHIDSKWFIDATASQPTIATPNERHCHYVNNTIVALITSYVCVCVWIMWTRLCFSNTSLFSLCFS